MLRRIFLVLWIGGLALWALPGCREDGALAGDRCVNDEDCKPPLVCTTSADPEATMGICVFPEALPDASVGRDAAREPDAATTPDSGSGADAESLPDAEPSQDASPGS